MIRTKSKMTIYTLSRELGISPSTVSKALNHSPEISAELRTRVQNLAKKNQFKPRLVSNRIPNICVLVQQFPGHPLDFSSYLARVMEGVAQYTREEGIEMSIFAADVQELNGTDLVRELRRRGASGAVVLRNNDCSDFFEQLDRQRFAYVSRPALSGPFFQSQLNKESMSAQLITSHLLELGHRHFAVLDHDPGSVASQQRMASISRVIKDAGITDTPVLIQSEQHQDGLGFGRHGLCTLVKQHPQATALLVFDYMVALGALRGATDSGIRIPQNLSLGCFDEYPESRYLSPSLTTVGMSIVYLGYQAARDVHRQIRGLEPLDFEQDTRLQPMLNVRESTGPAKHF